jgi:hypothetical protein
VIQRNNEKFLLEDKDSVDHLHQFKVFVAVVRYCIRLGLKLFLAPFVEFVGHEWTVLY